MGMTLGCIEATVNHPLWAFGVRVSTHLPWTLNPKILYSGFGVHCAGSLPVDTIQTTIGRLFFERVISKDRSETERRLLAGFTGGALSNFVMCPMEMVMTRQQKYPHETASQATKAIYSAYKTKGFFIGFSPLLVREGLFFAGVFGGVPLLAKKCKEKGISEFLTVVISGIGIGSTTAFLSQPLAVTGSVMQVFEKNISSFATAKEIYASNGVTALYAGLPFRLARVSSSVLILGNLTRFFETYFNLPLD
ncbi:MAG: hypothetical protein A3F67_11080 [Verrucomicrobia bacterium RIFCSPHIGHO2_12_FULL_41_10]|nr:MAG: hypothetical protein A3F67_11080 [Verrucomicrobia bacterium RIFCSPHIGHO2_12_FULL_41_10]